jgi:methionyl aminopeptidase
MIGRNDDCWCGSGKKWKKCHFPHSRFGDESFEILSRRYLKQWGIILKTPSQIAGIRRASHLAARILDEVCLLAQEGVTTNYLNKVAHKKIVDAGAIPASLGYGRPPFPKSICTSLNEVICHGIPDDTSLLRGDILNIDLAVILEGYFGDCGKMVAIGPVTPDKKLVFDVSLAGLKAAAAILKPGVLLHTIGDAISDIAEQAGCSVITQFVGHGVGIQYHEQPNVPHCRNDSDIPLVPGMTFTIEPMINFGGIDMVIDPVDRWTARTADGSPSAQWEYAFLITNDGAEILTPWTKTSCEEETLS